MKALAKEKVESFPAVPAYPSVARFEFFRKGDRPSGVWIVRQGPLRFALPFTTGTKPGVADYLPAPHGLSGFSVPVEQIVPAGASHYELADGRVLIATDSADSIEPASDGRSVRATWRRFVVKGGKVGEWVEPGFEVSTTWRINGATLSRSETIIAKSDVTLRRMTWILTSTANKSEASSKDGAARMTLTGREGTLGVQTSGDLVLPVSIQDVSPETPLGRGARGAIPIYVTFEAQNVQLQAGRPRTWNIALTVSSTQQAKAGK